MASVKRKHHIAEEKTDLLEDSLFVDAPPDKDSDDGDSTDSDASSAESQYSGLEDEPDTSEEDEEEEEEDDSGEEGEDEEDEEESSDGDEESDSEKTVTTAQTKSTKTNIAHKNNKNNAKSLKKKKSDGRAARIKEEVVDVAATSQSITLPAPNEYAYDSSDEEDVRNTVGNIPMEWYREYEHIGYDLTGKKIIKPPSGDELDEFLSRMENPEYWRTVKDKLTGQNVVLTDKDVDIVERFKKGKYVDASFDPYKPWVDMFSHDVMQHPLTAHPPQKRSFIPSRWEKLRVSRMVHSIKMGWMKPSTPKTQQQEDEEAAAARFYELWKKEEETELSRLAHHIPAPKMTLPGHAESYNPPPEYLLTEEEELAWKEQEPSERRQNFVPQKFSALRLVPSFERFINERFERCLDLYLCPRQRKMRMNVNPEDLIPKLPKPRDLQPFPTTQSIVYRGHTGLVRTLSPSPCGQWLVSGSDDGTVRLWEVSTGRCVKKITVETVVKDVVWTPNPGLSLIAIAIEKEILLMNPGVGDSLVTTNTDNMLSSYDSQDSSLDPKKKAIPVTWSAVEGGEEYKQGIRLRIKHPKAISHISWQAKGDYLSVVMPEAEGMSVLIHQISKRRSQNPFRKPKGLVQCVLFHPTRPYLFVATQRYVRVYNLVKQELTKKLLTNCKWVSSMAVHPAGDNLIIGSYDCKLAWFDLDLSSKPYQTLRHHKKALRSVAFHKNYPLFASASDDGTVIVCHGRVYNDLLQNPLIVPVKVLRGHESTKNLGVLDCVFHPSEPWLFSSGSDNTVRLFT